MKLELSDAELFLIGSVVAQWSALEFEVFSQTLASYISEGPGALPKSLNGIQFTETLSLWRKRVVDTATGNRHKKLVKEHGKILHYKEQRDALVHGMWDFTGSDLEEIVSIRVKKKTLIKARFTAKELSDLGAALGAINFNIRFPGGLKDFAKRQAANAPYMSRRFLAMMTDHPIQKDWISPLIKAMARTEPNSDV